MEVFIVWVVVVVIIAVGLVSRYRIATSNQILVVTGKVGEGQSSKTIHGGGMFVWPLIQKHSYLDLSPINLDIELTGALSRQNIRVNVPSSFTIAISTEKALMHTAAERILDKTQIHIRDMASEIIFGQLRATIADMSIEEINADRDRFITNVQVNVEGELKKLGLMLINVNITDITDESGYIEALGKKAAARAIEQARVDVAEKKRDGATGEANANQVERTNVAAAEAKAVAGENEAQIKIADSNAEKEKRAAEANRKSEAARLTQDAKAKEEGYYAQALEEIARANQEKERLTAENIVPAEIAKQEVVIAAEAQKQKDIKQGEAEGEALQAKLTGEAQGNKEILLKRAEGLKALVDAAGNDADKAAMLMIAEDLPEITNIQVGAIKNIKFDKIVVWDQGGKSDDGSNATGNFVKNMMNIVPPQSELFKMTGMQLPEWIGKDISEAAKANNDFRVEPKPAVDVDVDAAVETDVEKNTIVDSPK
jgi:flotillin